MTVATVAIIVTVVTVVTKQLCTPNNLNLPKTYLPTYLCKSSYSSDSSDISDQKKTFFTQEKCHRQKNYKKNGQKKA